MNAIPKIVPLSDLRTRPGELLRQLADEPIILTQRGRPVAVLVSLDKWEHILERLEDADDILYVLEARETSTDFVDFDDYLAGREEDVST